MRLPIEKLKPALKYLILFAAFLLGLLLGFMNRRESISIAYTSEDVTLLIEME